LLFLPVLATAQGVFTAPTLGGFTGGLTGVITAILTVLWVVFVAIAIVYFVIAGISFLSSQGDPTKAGQARSAVIYGSIGIVVALIAYSIILIIRNIFGV